MTLPFNAYGEIASITARFTPGDGEFATGIDNLFLSRRSQPVGPLHTAYRPCFALVLQGAKSLRLGAETLNYGTGDYLLTSLDLPVASRVVEASEQCRICAWRWRSIRKSWRRCCGAPTCRARPPIRPDCAGWR
jgi:hypothetical protein